MTSKIKRNTFLLTFIILNISLSQAEQIYDSCELPESPAIPVGSVTEEQLLAAVSTVKTYQGELEKFRNCIDQLKVTIDENSMDEKTIEKSKEVNIKLDTIYNASIDREQAVADRLNKQIRLFKSNQEFKNNETNPN